MLIPAGAGYNNIITGEIMLKRQDNLDGNKSAFASNDNNLIASNMPAGQD
jgi:hypothetical protein